MPDRDVDLELASARAQVLLAAAEIRRLRYRVYALKRSRDLWRLRAKQWSKRAHGRS